MIGLLVRRMGRGIRQVRYRHSVGPALRFSPRVEPLDGRVLPGGLSGDDFGAGLTPRTETVLVHVDDPMTRAGSKLGSGTDGVIVWADSPEPVGTLGSKPGGAGDGIAAR